MSSLDTRKSTLAQGRVAAGSQTPGEGPLLPLSQKPANPSVLCSDSTLCLEGQCGRMSAHMGVRV